MPFTSSNFRAGIAAAKARHGGRASATSSRAGDFFTPPSVRRQRIEEVDDKIARFAQDMQLADGVPPELQTQFSDFRRRWENWMEGLHTAAVVLPGSGIDEWLDRAEEQLKIFETELQKAGATQTFKGQTTPFKATNVVPPEKDSRPKDDNAWRTIALLTLGAAAVAAITISLNRPKVTVLQQPSPGL